ncbi:sensor histidine kinase [Terribacillus saccharophilus]|uniref:histidine kinase n=1 Tax=Terribacillus saccharophilus TaxID=361277 RepID=A0A075LFN7_9BACI|nr:MULTISPECIES: HAMP domain-containing sensor histidine kinase [Terribacillus]AIF65500.1 histidine kinase [Terribacillus goriensis]MCM3227658.1 HAMP domain-containing histidine kinase [Terribacillus saccharophilus]MEC0302376.1 HAMP domain-containing sensor histidine kinase [Terribacillus saccharophilus]SEN68734.1 Signal transduction histidine kinase [Terribacillus saccharophilus]
MRLKTQLNIAFTTLLIIVMGFTAITLYSQLKGMLVTNETRQLEESGQLLLTSISGVETIPAGTLDDILNKLDLKMFLYDESEDELTYTNLVRADAERFAEKYDTAPTQKNTIWQDNRNSYVVKSIATGENQNMVILRPIRELEEVQESFFQRIFLVFLIGVMIAILISTYLTQRLVKPLTELKYQLKKIQRREFDNIKSVKASGEIKEVEQSAIEMAKELNRYITSQRQFFQNASHELKTPLMTIQGYAEGIKDGVFTGKDQEHGLEVVVSEIKRLKQLINEMILLAKLDSEEGIYKEEQLEIKELVNLTIDRALPIASDKDIQLTYNKFPAIVINGDKEKLLRAMMNITSNAVRHAGSQVHISVQPSSIRQVEITINDDGPGISEDLLPNMFQRFVKGEGGETGLGLAISRAIVERHNGIIRAGKSDLGGASFTIIL